MTRQTISIGSSANDGTGDTLRQAAQKMNENFVELYVRLGGDSNTLSSQITIEDSAIAFEGSLPDGNETRLAVVNPTSDRLVQIPDASGFIVIDTATQTLTNKTLTSPSLTTPSITTSINDANGNESIKLTATGSAVNEITVINAATSNAPTISATGTDTNVNLGLLSKGTGSIEIDKLALTSVEQTSNGAASATVSHIICNKGTALAVSLADGTTSGEYKIFTNKGAGIATVTPANFAQGASFALDQYDAATVIWDGANWYISGHYGATVS
jgi:hypothetical protein